MAKKVEETGKNPKNYQAEWHDSFVFEQKLVEIDMFNDEQEKEVKERVEKRTKKRQEVAEKDKALKRQKNSRERKTRWGRTMGLVKNT